MAPSYAVVSANPLRERARPDTDVDDAGDRLQTLLQVARTELALVCSVACKVAAVLILLEALFRVAGLGDRLATGVFAAAATAPQGAVPQHSRSAHGAR